MIDLVGGRSLDAATLDRMVDALYLRGPDDRGTAIEPPLAFGMRRLSIIDLEGGHQPIYNEDQSISVVMNGELYSYPEMRKGLVGAGHEFRTNSDTEVLVHGYEQWGIEGLLSRLNGMFAFCLHDKRKESVFIVRDRLGIKPLLYTIREGQLLFSSALGSLLASGCVPIEPDPMGVRLYLMHQYVPGAHTVLEGVKKLPPACYIEVHGGEVSEPKTYWRLPEIEKEEKSFEDWSEECRDLLTDAVKVHMISDVEVGIFLSGGLDSSIVLGLMSQVSDHPIQAFSIGFEDEKTYDESPYARMAADRFGAEFHHTVFTAEHILELAADVVRHLEEPIGDAACLPTYLLSKQAREGVKVVLSGEGADELFAGYGYYNSLPPRRPGPTSNFKLEKKQGLFSRFLHGPMEGRIQVTSTVGMYSRQSGFPYALSPDYVDLLVPDLEGSGQVGAEVRSVESSWISGRENICVLDKALATDTQGWLPENLLMKVDRTTMAHSLEARVPFLDYRVAELAFRMPAECKLKNGTGKAVLRHAFGDLLGKKLMKRKKHGFNLPMHHWVRSELRPLLDWTLSQKGLPSWVDYEAVDALRQAHYAKRGCHERSLWCLHVLSAWFQEIRSAHPDAPTR